MKAWAVMRNRRFFGVIESNFEYASKWWKDYQNNASKNPDGATFRLHEITL